MESETQRKLRIIQKATPRAPLVPAVGCGPPWLDVTIRSLPAGPAPGAKALGEPAQQRGNSSQQRRRKEQTRSSEPAAPVCELVLINPIGNVPLHQGSPECALPRK